MSSESVLLYSLYFNGCIKREDNPMARINSLYNEYTIEIERKQCKKSKWINSESSYQFLCKFLIKNNIGLPVLEITTTEIDIFLLIDIMNQIYYINSSLKEVSTFVHSVNENMKEYKFYFYRELNNIISLSIIQHDIISNTEIVRCKISFDDDLFDNCISIIYFIFLIDIDDESIMTHRNIIENLY